MRRWGVGGVPGTAGDIDDTPLDLKFARRRNQQLADAVPEELLHGRPVVRSFSRQRCFALGIVEERERAKQQQPVHVLPIGR